MTNSPWTRSWGSTRDRTQNELYCSSQTEEVSEVGAGEQAKLSEYGRGGKPTTQKSEFKTRSADALDRPVRCICNSERLSHKHSSEPSLPRFDRFLSLGPANHKPLAGPTAGVFAGCEGRLAGAFLVEPDDGTLFNRLAPPKAGLDPRHKQGLKAKLE
jgi:hypothetical protein